MTELGRWIMLLVGTIVGQPEVLFPVLIAILTILICLRIARSSR